MILKRNKGGNIVLDKRSFHMFILKSGQRVETKADSMEEAKLMIEVTLKEEIPNDFLCDKAA